MSAFAFLIGCSHSKGLKKGGIETAALPNEVSVPGPKIPAENNRSFVCPEWAELGPRVAFFATPSVARSKPGLGSKPPFSIKLPKAAQLAPWWITKGIPPACEAPGVECSFTPRSLFEKETNVQLCGQNPGAAPIRLLTLALWIDQHEGPVSEILKRSTPNCLIDHGRFNSDGEYPERLSRFESSPSQGLCIAEASNLKSWEPGAPKLHYLSVMRFKVHPRGYLQEAAIIFVIDEKDWSLLQGTIRASAETFEVDWKHFSDRITSTFWDLPV